METGAKDTLGEFGGRLRVECECPFQGFQGFGKGDCCAEEQCLRVPVRPARDFVLAITETLPDFGQQDLELLG